ncbi:hypothetical protein CYFUS_004619 [Cystobacter fuscus]|uniref:Uncharacterized protein n=1 Tax=Cystobacter fuscus TaxID=43 RepID=A0A250J6M9_9BACT|nr:hypothetical protein [Cystobacter fuscus]ATB39178.1 hypothetical protein CYFUS_004619 [Cystobacter fuscus]
MKVELVTLEVPFLHLENPAARESFMDMQRVRAAAYRADFGDRYMPFDTSDFVARHHLFYVQTESGREPVAAFKQVALATCDAHGLELPALGIFGGRSPEHVEALSELILQHRRSGRHLLYGGSWGMRFWARMGYVPLLHRGQPLPKVAYSEPGEELVLISLTEPSPWALECRERQRQVLEERRSFPPRAPSSTGAEGVKEPVSAPRVV